MKRKPRKQVLVPGQVEELTKYQFHDAMTRLMKNKDFQLLQSRWVMLRGDILEAGKEKRQPEQWAVLQGFDDAITEPDKWLRYEVEQERAQAQIPTEDLES